MPEQIPDWKHDTVSFDPVAEGLDEKVDRLGPVTDKVSELAPDIIAPIIVPPVEIAENGIFKVIKKTRDAAAVTGDIVWSVIKVAFTGEH